MDLDLLHFLYSVCLKWIWITNELEICVELVVVIVFYM